MNLLAVITTGYALDNAERLGDARVAEISRRIKDGGIEASELLELGFSPVHYEGLAWKEMEG